VSSKPNIPVFITKDPEARYLRTVFVPESDTLEGAVQGFLRAVELAPESAQRALLVARQLAGAGARIEAELVLRRALARCPHRSDLRQALVRLLVDDGREGQALAELAAAVRVEPEDISLRLTVDRIRERLGRP
jgi:predicted Zn-dependent protease